MRKRSCLTIFVVSLALLGLISAPAMAEGEDISDKVSVSGAAIFAAGWANIEDNAGDDTTLSDLALCSVELAFDAEVNEWVNVHAVLFYEQPLFGDPEDVVLDEGIVTIGNTEKYPLYLAAGLMYVPFGALQTHFPADPVIAAPVTLLLGETQEKALLIGVEHQGLSASVYAFRGHWDTDYDGDEIEDADTESYGADVHYNYSNEDQELTIGASYISNICETDGLEEEIDDLIAAFPPTIDGFKDDVGGAAAYLHIGAAGFFLEGEYMTALDDIEGTLAGVVVHETKPAVWNIEAGYNLDVAGKNLELALKYAGSNDDAADTGLPEDRYGVCANLEVLHNTVVSLGYLHDDYSKDVDDDKADMVLAAVTVEF